MKTKITRLLAANALAQPYLEQKNLVTLITADHKVLSDNCESRNNHRYAVVVQDLATQWIQPDPWKTKLLRKPREACKSSWSQLGNLKSFLLTTPKNLAKLVKIYPGIIVRQHLTVQKRMALLKELYAVWQKERLQYCCNQVWMKNGGRILWSRNSRSFLTRFNISWFATQSWLDVKNIGISHWTNLAKTHRWDFDQTSEPQSH